MTEIVHITEHDKTDTADLLIDTTRGRMQHRVDACLERFGGDVKAATESNGIGISFGFARDIVSAFDHASKEIARLRAARGPAMFNTFDKAKIVATVLTDNGQPARPPEDDTLPLDDVELARWRVCMEIVRSLTE